MYDPLDAAALVAAAALDTHFVNACDLPHEELSFAAKTVVRIGEGAVGPRPSNTKPRYLMRVPTAAPLERFRCYSCRALPRCEP